MGTKRHGKPTGIKLSAGRPPTASKQPTSISSAATRALIRSHHNLNKELEKAKTTSDTARVHELQKRIDELGGLQKYQQASIQGQASDRGGDSSIVLMKWLEPQRPQLAATEPKLRMLEIGALSTNNACSRSSLFEMERIDLNSQGEGILKQDFMERPLPANEGEKFDIISLSLVLNYVPDAVGRGEMLRRMCQFLRPTPTEEAASELEKAFPLLFLVLPAPCVVNSRFMNDKRLMAILKSLGFALLQRKQTAKLVYYLLKGGGATVQQAFPKKEVNPGLTRNNFCVLLEKRGKVAT